jgi:hypothetical protein
MTATDTFAVFSSVDGFLALSCSPTPRPLQRGAAAGLRVERSAATSKSSPTEPLDERRSGNGAVYLRYRL